MFNAKHVGYLQYKSKCLMPRLVVKVFVRERLRLRKFSMNSRFCRFHNNCRFRKYSRAQQCQKRHNCHQQCKRHKHL